MLDKGIRKSVEIPEEVEVTIEKDNVKIKGPNGEISKEFDFQKIEISREDNNIIIYSESSKKVNRAAVGTVKSHINNMIKGVTEGFTSNLKVVYSHFPVTVNVSNGKVKIENFLGEEKPRYAEIVGDTEVEIKGEEIEVRGPNKDDVGQTAANIEQTAQVKRKDPRVFQDGVYIEKRP